MRLVASSTGAGERLAVLDGWRGLAVLTLLAGHFVPHLGLDAPAWSANFGRVGVELFLALSGCLMGTLLFEREMALRTFAARRFARIVPSMWVFLAVACGVTLLRGGPLTATSVGLSLTGWANVQPLLDAGEQPVRLGHLWSVCVELQGYAVLGGLAAVSRRWRLDPVVLIGTVVALGWAALGLQVACGAPLPYYTTFWRPDTRLTAMLLGTLFVAMHDRDRWRWDRLPAWPLVLGTGLLLQVNLVPDVFKYTIGAALIALGCAGLSRAAGPGSRWLGHPALVAFGTASYSLYLWQQIFYADKGLLRWPVALAMAVLTGFAAHHLWDRWLHQWTAARLERQRWRPRAI
ncbi:acyltransferase family protein [Sphaerotilus sp.]|uniref:acyltransferase family protein n=1 Tax=Sphaerotilus sp. TaxID=2093942 RepID=UPI0034E2E83D